MSDVLGDRTARVIAGRSIWDELTPLLAPYSTSITAAVAYVGSGASTILGLQRGSAIIVDADRKTVRSGSTDPRVLLDWVKAGVKVYSLKGLHAKMILAEAVGAEHDAFAVIGSANLSQSSATRLFESVALADGECLEEVRIALIKLNREATPLKQAALENLIADFGIDRTTPPDDEDVDEVGVESDGEDEVEPDYDSERPTRPRLLHLCTLARDVDVTEEAVDLADRLSEEYGIVDNLDYRIDMFCGVGADSVMYGKDEYIIAVDGTKNGRPRRTGAVNEPGRLVHTYPDDFASPPRRYYYLLVQRSKFEVTVPDIESAFEPLGERPNFRGKYVRTAFVGALLDLWPDLEYKEI
ncbi:phospholipase D family protein [Rhodococcus marinonascens]|uniref:phospholipase D family protein n=1 Tax=Rhodococcus marinonascens TaxID=38311 RepID=UPI00093373E9|nr:phospholipase D family protein [Rhodococcus marinonascens]